MKLLNYIREKLTGMSGSIMRFPLTFIFLLASAVMIAVDIETDHDLMKYIMTCAVGALACVFFQAAYERLSGKSYVRFIMMAAGIIIAVIFFFFIQGISVTGPKITMRMIMTMSALFIAFLWIAEAGSEINFSESFMCAFKYFFLTLLYSGVIMGGCSAIIAAIDRLIIPIDSNAYSHIANVIFVLFAPMFFLSLMPVYTGSKAYKETDKARADYIKARVSCPRFLEILLSYIIVPLASVFTVILVIYIILNINGEFWSDNLLEPMLISYSAVIIIVSILTGKLENKMAVWFRKIFPKVLIPIAIFQVAASILILLDAGVTFDRYYVIMFGLFAVGSGFALSFYSAQKSGGVAVLFIALSIISIIPPVDAFSVSRVSKIAIMDKVLSRNGMFTNGAVTPNGSIPDEDKQKIRSSIEYLVMTDELKYVMWLPDDFEPYNDNDFIATFGFKQYGGPDFPGSDRYVNIHTENTSTFSIENYDLFTFADIYWPTDNGSTIISQIERGGNIYSLTQNKTEDGVMLVLADNEGQELVRFDTAEIIERYRNYTNDKAMIAIDDATFTSENENAGLTVIVKNADIRYGEEDISLYTQVFIFIDLK